MRRWIGVGWLMLAAGELAAQALALDPAVPTPLDTVRLRYTHVGCTNPDSIRIAQAANRITVAIDRLRF